MIRYLISTWCTLTKSLELKVTSYKEVTMNKYITITLALFVISINANALDLKCLSKESQPRYSYSLKNVGADKLDLQREFYDSNGEELKRENYQLKLYSKEYTRSNLFDKNSEKVLSVYVYLLTYDNGGVVIYNIAVDGSWIAHSRPWDYTPNYNTAECKTN